MEIVKKIDLNSPIIPEQGIGEIKLLENAFSLRPIILSNTLSTRKSDWTFTTVTQFPDWLNFNYKDSLTITINIYTGKIVSLTVKNQYTGKIFDSIGIGSLVKDLFNLDSGFYYDELDEYILHKEDFNIQFDLDMLNRLSFTEQDVLNSKITEITILNHPQSTTIVGATEFPIEWTK